MCDKNCIFFFFPIINKYFLMAKRSLLSRCPSYYTFQDGSASSLNVPSLKTRKKTSSSVGDVPFLLHAHFLCLQLTRPAVVGTTFLLKLIFCRFILLTLFLKLKPWIAIVILSSLSILQEAHKTIESSLATPLN